MDELNEKMSTNQGKKVLNPFALKKPKKRSLVERELETNMTARVTSPVTFPDGVSTSRYGRARRTKLENDNKNISIESLQSPTSENTPVKPSSASKTGGNSFYKTETPKKAFETSLDNIDNIYQENKSLSRFNMKEESRSAFLTKKTPKVYIRTDLIQNRDDDDDIILIKDLFSPKGTPRTGRKSIKSQEVSAKKSTGKKSEKPQAVSIEKSKKILNGHFDNVVKALDFGGNKSDTAGKKASDGKKSAIDGKKASDGKKSAIDCIKVSDRKNKSDGNKNAIDDKKDSDDNKNAINVKKGSAGNKNAIDGLKGSYGNTKKKDDSEQKPAINELFEVEASCPYQVGDLAWARMGTFPFWPCIVTRDPANDLFVRRKLFGRIEHYILHVTFFADNGRRSWIVDNMLRKYMGLNEFISTRDKFTSEDKKKDPRLYAAFFISEKKQSLWNSAVEEAEIIKCEPKRLRVDVFHDILYNSKATKKQQKSGKVLRTDSDVSLSESLYDSLFSEDDSKVEDSIRTRNRSKNRSLDVSDVVTACLDNMAAKTGNIKIQRQSHMDRWLQKAKSKTPEKVNGKNEQASLKVFTVIPKTEPIDNVVPELEVVTSKDKITPKVEKPERPVSNSKKRKLPTKEVKITKIYSLRRSYESQNSFVQESDETADESINKISSENESNTKRKSVNSGDAKIKDSIDKVSESNNKVISAYNSQDEITTTKQPKNSENVDDNSDEVLNAIDAFLGDHSENNAKTVGKEIPTQETVSEKLPTESEIISLEIKPEIMDVDENLDSEVQDVETKNSPVLDSPANCEESSINHVGKKNGNDVSPDKKYTYETLNGKSPVKIEDLVETRPQTTSDTKTTQKTINEEIEKPTNVDDSQTSTSPLKSNEMVLIPENCSLTDDDNSMTSMEDDARKTVGVENSNSNSTCISVRTVHDIENVMEHTKTAINETSLVTPAEKPNTVQEGISVEKSNAKIEETDEPNENDMSVDELIDEDVNMSTKDQNVISGSHPQTDSKIVELNEDKNSNKEESINDSRAAENKLAEEMASNNSKTSNPFLDDSRNIDCVDSANVTKKYFFRKDKMNKPPDLSSSPKSCELDQNDSDYDEESDDDPSPEFEPLGEEITEDFRQHMMCIESNITDKKDDAQIVKVCNEIAVLEESKTKLSDIKASISKACLENSDMHESQDKLNDKQILSELSLESDKLEFSSTTIVSKSRNISREIEAQDDILKSVKNVLKSPTDRKRYRLSLKKDKPETDNTISEDTINSQYKTIDQIEEIIKSKPKKLPLENEEICIPAVIPNGFNREIYTPEIEDDDFDIDNASVSSEDSEISLPQNNVAARRSLRSKPEKKVGLEDPEFLAYMDLRQDDLMEEHPDLTRDDIVLYLYKTYTYSQNLKSDIKLEESPLALVKTETPTIQQPSRKKSKKQVQPKNTIENFFREKYNKSKKSDTERAENVGSSSNENFKPSRETSISPVDSGIGNSKDSNECFTPVSKRKTRSKSPKDSKEVTKEIKVELIKETNETSLPKTPKRLRKRIISPRVLGSDSKMSIKYVNSVHHDKRVPVVVISPLKKPLAITQKDNEMEPLAEIDNKPDETEDLTENDKQAQKVAEVLIETKHEPVTEVKYEILIQTKHEDTEPESKDSDSETPLRLLRSKVLKEKHLNGLKKEISEVKVEVEVTASVSSESEPLLKLKPKKDKSLEGSYEDPEFLKYMELKQDVLIDDNPDLSQNELKAYLYKTWIYEKDSKSDMQKNEEIESSNLVKGINPEPFAPQRKVKRKLKSEKAVDVDEKNLKEKPKRKTVSHYYNEEFISDIDDELEVFEIFKTKKTTTSSVSKQDSPKKEHQADTNSDEALKSEDEDVCEEINTLNDVELYFKQLVSPKPSVFKGLNREKVCGVCEDITNLTKCIGCHGFFHYDCVYKVAEVADTEKSYAQRARKKKKKPLNGRKSNEITDERKDQSEENVSMDDTLRLTIDAESLESKLEAKMKELMEKETQINYDSYSSDDGIDWTETVPGKCELIEVKLKRKDPPIDYSSFKCHNCRIYDRPVCFVCKAAVSKTGVKFRQKCNVAHCHSYYHLECLDHWPQTQYNAGEWRRSKNELLDSLTCPRHVCHTCVSDDPRGCRTRFSGDKLAKCVRCPATYHSFNKCLPAGTQILTASFIICPRHYEHRPGKVSCHVNTGWCFICALGGSLICCEYCPTSFHAECLNIKPPEGNYMCEDCETGRLPLYGEMVWVKLGLYRWWPGVVLHPSEIPDNIMAVKHGLGEFVVRFFGQYDHYWVNRGRVFPYQEGDSGKVSSQKSKIDADFTTAMEHAQRAYEILKNALPDDEETSDIASSLLPPHYIKLKSNKPIGSLLGRKAEDPSLSLTQCECSPAEVEPCGAHSQCLNRVLLTECGPTCRAGERCNNRAFEKRQYPKLTPYRTPHRGWGLKTLDDIKAGQFVIEYVGELIDMEEFQRRMTRKHEIRDENFYFLTLDKERMIDAGPKGNLARFMNHCCEPNCETQKWTVLGDVRVGLFAIDDIKANSEVTFNYNLECSGIEKKQCMCGAKRCSGYIGAKPKQLDESQKRKNVSITTKRKYTKRKETEDSPSTSKNKPKRPLGRPRKEKPPKELTELEKDLLIIKSATPNSDESEPPSVDDKKTIISPNTTEQDAISHTESKNSKEESNSKIAAEVPKLNGIVSEGKVLKIKLDPNLTEEVRLLNGEVKLKKKDTSTLKRKALNSDDVTMNIEPSAKRHKCDKRIDVGD